jgi:hypothetical protein
VGDTTNILAKMLWFAAPDIQKLYDELIVHWTEPFPEPQVEAFNPALLTKGRSLKAMPTHPSASQDEQCLLHGIEGEGSMRRDKRLFQEQHGKFQRFFNRFPGWESSS